MASVYEIVRDRIIKQLEAGVVPWKQTWTDLSPVNIMTFNEYRGINRILLAGHKYWGTLRQIEKAGGSVKEGEEASGFVFFWSRAGGNNSDTIAADGRKKPVVRYYPVFNLSQCEGIRINSPTDLMPSLSCEELIKRNIHSAGTGKPSYNPDTDSINMPPADLFGSYDAYYSAYFHELTHWTGHSSRLCRPGVSGGPAIFGSGIYSREELIAEMGAAFLCAACGIHNESVSINSASYISGWLSHIRESPSGALVRAAADAQRAAEYLEFGGKIPL